MNTPPLQFQPAHIDEELDWELEAMSTSPSAHFCASSNDILDAESAVAYRDAPLAFASGLDLNEALFDNSFASKDMPAFVPAQMKMVASPLSPAAFNEEMPVKDEFSAHSFLRVNPSFSSRAAPLAVMESLERALSGFEDCSFERQGQWAFRVSWVCVAEELSFSVALSRPAGGNNSVVEIDFLLRSGDEAKFVEIADCVRAQCADVDGDVEAILLAGKTLEPWIDARQELRGRRFAISETEAAELIADLNAELHADSLYEVAKLVKTHCRHRGNRRLFLRSDLRAGFVHALRWMLGDNEELARFGVFIMQQLARDEDAADGSLFSSAFERNSVSLQLESLAERETSEACSRATRKMVAEVQRSWLLC